MNISNFEKLKRLKLCNEHNKCTLIVLWKSDWFYYRDSEPLKPFLKHFFNKSVSYKCLKFKMFIKCCVSIN